MKKDKQENKKESIFAFLLSYLYHRRLFFLVEAAFCMIFFCSFLLYHLPIKAIFYPTLLCAVLGMGLIVYDFQKKHKKCQTLQKIRSMVDVIERSLPTVEGMDELAYQEIIHLLQEEHRVFCQKTEQEYDDMIAYYTVWVHQIKTPIASMRLTLEGEDSLVARKVQTDLHRIEQYVEMVLTFLRLNSKSTDYVIRETSLDIVIRQAVKRFSQEFITRKLSLSYEPSKQTVISDEKWLSFVIEQLLSNALKYTRMGGVTITVGENDLSIQDTGIGIAPEDLPRIFENGYTGLRGREDKRASGIGLYLCKRICDNLGHEIFVESWLSKGTKVTIGFSSGSLSKM